MHDRARVVSVCVCVSEGTSDNGHCIIEHDTGKHDDSDTLTRTRAFMACIDVCGMMSVTTYMV